MFCSNCGEKINLKAKFCCHCGTKTQVPASHQEKKPDETSGTIPKKPVKRVASEDPALSDDDFIVAKATPTKEGERSSDAVVNAVNSLKKMFQGGTSPATYTVDFMLHAVDKKSIQKGNLTKQIDSKSSPEDWDISLNSVLKYGRGAKFYQDKTLETECNCFIQAKRMKTMKHRKNIKIYTVIPMGRAMLKQQLKDLNSVDPTIDVHFKKSAVASPPPPKDNEEGQDASQNENVMKEKSPQVVHVSDDEELPIFAAQEDSSQDRGNQSREAASGIDMEGAEEESHEMQQFIQLQEKLIERQRLAEARQDRQLGVPSKYIIVFYVARDKKGYMVPTYDGDKITDIYDRIVTQIPPELLAPRFVLHSESGDRIGPEWKGDLTELSHVKLIEEPHDLNDTLTNFDDVMW